MQEKVVAWARIVERQPFTMYVLSMCSTPGTVLGLWGIVRELHSLSSWASTEVNGTENEAHNQLIV